MRNISIPTKVPAVRDAGPADLSAVADLFDRYRQFYDQAPDRMLAREFMGQRMANKESVILLADGGGEGLLGFCQLYPTFCSVEAAPIYVLYDLFVSPAARGRGIGRLLLQTAHARALADGKVRMDLTTAHNNTNAQALYESLGWVRDEVFRTYNLRVAAA
jgi:ribosomal protein S18 acetylase RimI-like enzyme